MNRTKLIAFVTVLVVASLACGSTSTGGQVVSTANNASQSTSAPPQVQTNKIGDVIQVGSQLVTLNSAQISGGNLQVNFTIENKGTESLALSSLMNFEAKSNDGTKLDEEIFDCPSGSLGGTVLAGDKLRGNICWKGLTTSSAKIYYTPELFSSTVIVWEVK